MNIKKGDTVKIISGKDRGKTGPVLRAMPDDNRLTVQGLNMFSKRVRPRRSGQKGEIVSIARPLHASNVMLVCPNCKKPTRVGHRDGDGKKVRYCKQCQATIA